MCDNIFHDANTSLLNNLCNDDYTRQIIERLKFMSKIKQGEKINVKDLFVRDNDSVLQRFLRTIKNMSTYLSSSDIVESKKATLKFISDTISNSIHLIQIYKNSDDEYKQKVADIIIINLEASKVGIRNLILTYQSDRKFMSEMETTIQTLEAKIDSIKIIMDGFSNESFMPSLTLVNND